MDDKKEISTMIWIWVGYISRYLGISTSFVGGWGCTNVTKHIIEENNMRTKVLSILSLLTVVYYGSSQGKTKSNFDCPVLKRQYLSKKLPRGLQKILRQKLFQLFYLTEMFQFHPMEMRCTLECILKISNIQQFLLLKRLKSSVTP